MAYIAPRGADMRQKEINVAINALKKASKQISEIEKKYPKKFEKELNDIGRSVIDEWYDSYDRHRDFYRPYGSLYSAFKVSVKNGIGFVKFSPRLMQRFTHYQKNTIIYNNSFLEGYHGGSWGKGVPEDGVPYWRTPFPFFQDWGDPAEKTFSPYEKMHTEMQKKIDEIESEYNADIATIQAKLAPHINRMNGG